MVFLENFNFIILSVEQLTEAPDFKIYFVQLVLLLVRHEYLAVALQKHIEFIAESAKFDDKIILFYLLERHQAQSVSDCIVSYVTVLEEWQLVQKWCKSLHELGTSVLLWLPQELCNDLAIK